LGQSGTATQWGGFISSHQGDLDNLNNLYRANNAIKFTSANYSGLTFGGLNSLGGVAGNTTRDQVWSVGANYARGPLAFSDA